MVFQPLDGFDDFDDQKVYSACEKALQKLDTLNFAIEFDGDNAYSALNLGASSLKNFLNNSRPKASTARWISIFCPDKQTECIAEISRKYELSPRLQGMISSKPLTPQHADTGNLRGKSLEQRTRRIVQDAMTFKPATAKITDPEKDSQDSSLSEHGEEIDLNHYHIADRVWHYYSTDWSARCLCVGYNSLSDMSAKAPEEPLDTDVEKPRKKNKTKRRSEEGNQNRLRTGFQDTPGGKRVWTWLLFCDDDTVISIHENPFPGCQDPLRESDEHALGQVRKNLRNVFRQLSTTTQEKRKEKPMDTLDIRPSSTTFQDTTVAISDSPGLIFYYLYDDWYTTLALVAKDKRQYASMLHGLREKMFEKARLSRIQQLHQTGRQLAVLKRMYQSYALIIERILSRHTPIRSLSSGFPPDRHLELSRLHVLSSTTSSSQHGSQSVVKDDQTFGAPLTSKVIVKFERLRDRINLYALSEIQECLDEKESLVFLNFNLITMRQSEAVEKLTRITILLAKVTILFMPVSLMTGYFSVQIADLQGVYTARTYWVCFGVIMALSVVFLLIFGVISHTLEGGLIYKSLTDVVFAVSKTVYRWIKARTPNP